MPGWASLLTEGLLGKPADRGAADRSQQQASRGGGDSTWGQHPLGRKNHLVAGAVEATVEGADVVVTVGAAVAVAEVVQAVVHAVAAAGVAAAVVAAVVVALRAARGGGSNWHLDHNTARAPYADAG